MTCELCGRGIGVTNIFGVCSVGGCRVEYYRRYRDAHPNCQTFDKVYLGQIRQRARKNGVPFTLTKITVPDIPSHCPVLGIPLERNLGARGPSPNSPSLDRIIPELGYVPGNVQWVSFRANRMKNNATPDELRRFAEWVLATVQS